MDSTPHRLAYRIGPVTLSVRADAAKAMLGDPASSQMDAALRDFQVAASDAAADLTIEARQAEPESAPTDAPPDATHRAGWDIYLDGDQALAVKAIPYGSSPSLRSLRVDFTARRAELRIAPRDPHAAHPLAYTLSELLVLMTAGWTGVALAHGACAIASGGAMLFTGASGSGKSTLASLWHESGTARVPGDESHLVWTRNGRPWVAGTPWPGSSGLWANESAPLDGVYFLEHGDANRLSDVSGAEALTALMAQCHLPVWSQCAMERVADVCEEVVRRVPARRFAFLPDASAVTFLRDRSGLSHPDAGAADLATELLKEGRPVRLRARGSSMTPCLREGDTIEIAPIEAREAEVGQILAARPPGAKSLVVHRLAERRGGDLILRGDACAKADAPAPPEAIAGRVVSRHRRGREARLDRGWRRATGRMVVRHGDRLREALRIYSRMLRALRGGPPLSIGSQREREADRAVLEAALGHGSVSRALDIANESQRYARLLPLLAHRLREKGEQLPAPLEEGEAGALIESARAEALLERLARVLDGAALRVVAIKGAALAFGGVYPEAHLRLGADIDTICDPLHRETLCEALTEAGFANAEPEYPLDYYLRYRREIALFDRAEPRGPSLEVHWGAGGHGYYDARLPAWELLNASRPGPWGESVRFLSPEMEALVLIVHMTKHIRRPHPVWALDLALLGAQGLDWERVEREILRRRLEWPAYYALRWIESRLPGAAPPGLTDRLREGGRRGRWLEARVLHAASPRGSRWIEALTLETWGARAGYLLEHVFPHRAVMERLYPEARDRWLAPYYLRRWGRILSGDEHTHPNDS